MMAEKFPEPEGTLPSDPGPAPTMDLNSDAYREWRQLFLARKKWVIARRQAAVAKSIDEIFRQESQGAPQTPVTTICLVIGAAYLDGSLHTGSGSVLDVLFG